MNLPPCAPLVSVVFPVYNAERFVAAALESVLSQSFRDFEVIVLNDGSTDRSLAEVERVAGSDPRVRVVSRPNKGLVETLNEGVALARGPWIARMDHDDVSMPDRFAIQLRHLEASDTDICGTAVTYFGEAPELTRSYPLSDQTIKFRLLYDCALAHPSVMARASLLKGNPYDVAAVHAEDYELWCRLAMKGAVFANIAQPLLMYRRHREQVSLKHQDEQRHCADKTALAYLRWYLHRNGLKDLEPLVTRTWAGRADPQLPSYAALLWQLEARQDIRDPHIAVHMCASAAVRGIDRAQAIDLYRLILKRGDTRIADRFKLVVSGLLGRSAYAGIKRMHGYIRNGR